MTPLERADKAKQLLNDPVIAEAFKDIREQIILRLEACPVSETETQHDLTITLQLLKQLKLQLSRYCDEIALDNAKKRSDSFMQRTRQTLLP